jgi:hypothetical protein
VSGWTFQAAADADLDAVAARLGGRWTADRLGWALGPPTGAGVVATRADGILAAAVPDVATRTAGTTPILRLVAAAGAPDGIAAALPALAAHAGRPLVAVGRLAALPPVGAAHRLPTWTTGPDPFVPLQRPIERFDTDHDALGRALVGTAWTIRRDAAWWAWRRAEPGVDLDAFDVPGPGGARGLVLVRDRRVRGVRALTVLELRALDRATHYDLLKAVRRLSWDRGSLPIVLRGEEMSRAYAFTAGYLPAGPAARAFGVRTLDLTSGAWRAWDADA